MKSKILEWLKKSLEFFKKITVVQKIVIGTIFVTVLLLLFFIGKTSSKPSEYPLYGVDYKISEKDMGKIETSLKGMNVKFHKTSGQIFVANEKTAMKLRAQLGMDGLTPDGIKGWELFDNQPFTTTDFERKINVRRAITDSIKKHLQLIDGIKSADVVISFGDNKYFQDDKEQFPLTASVVINTDSVSDITSNKNKIRGLRDLIAKGVDELKPANVVIMDGNGTVLTKNLEPTAADANVQLAKEHLQITEQERMKIYQALKKQLETVFTKSRFDVKVNLELNWDIEKTKKHLILPTIIKPDNPDTPYDDSVVKESVTVSSKTTKEGFKGQGYIPEGPAGIEDQVPPGLKEKMDRYNTYQKSEDLNNQEFSKADKEIIRQPYIISKVSVSVFLDGTWVKLRNNNGDFIFKNGTIQRKFNPVDKDQVRSVENSIKSLVGFDSNRGDNVSVNAIQFDRFEEFSKEDSAMLSRIHRQKLIMSVILSLLAIFVLFIVSRIIRKEIDRRKRLKEEEIMRQQEALRLSSLNSASDDSSIAQIENEVQNQVMHFSKDNPEDVAKLLRTWLNTDE